MHAAPKPPFQQCFISLLGRRGVGKSTITERWHKGSLSIKHSSNIGFDFAQKVIPIFNGSYSVTLIDNPGAKRFCGFAHGPLRMSHAVVFVVNVTVRKTFERMAGDLAWFSKHFEAHNPVICIVATKIDLTAERKVSSAELSEFAARCGFHYFEVCPQTGLNIEPLFSTLAQDVYYRCITKIALRPITALAENGEFSGDLQSTSNFDFSELLFPGQFTDMEFAHDLNGLRISLHKDILDLYNIQAPTLARLARIDFPRRVFWHFFRSLYGSLLLHFEMCYLAPPNYKKESTSSGPSPEPTIPSTSSAAPPPLSVFERATDMIRLSYLFSIISLRKAVKWAESVLTFCLLPDLTLAERVALLAFAAEFALKNDQFLPLITMTLQSRPEEVLNELRTSEAMMRICKSDPTLYTSLVFKIAAPQSSASYSPIPVPQVQKMDEWLMAALQRSWKSALLNERRNRSSAAASSSSPAPEASASAQVAEPTSARSPPLTPSSVAIYTEKSPHHRFIIPDWLIWMRWKALQHRIPPRSSTGEVRSICLSNTIDHNALELIVQYLYDEKVSDMHYARATFADVLQFGADLGLLMSSPPTKSNSSRSEASSSDPTSDNSLPKTATKHFSKLITLCRATLNSLTVDNCLQKLQSFAPTSAKEPLEGLHRLELAQTIDFLAENVQRLEASPSNLNLIDRTQDAAFKHIFIKRMQPPFEKPSDEHHHN